VKFVNALRDFFAAPEGSVPFATYIDTNDWWIGYYRGPNHHYVCPLPTLVIRWRRGQSEETLRNSEVER